MKRHLPLIAVACLATALALPSLAVAARATSGHVAATSTPIQLSIKSDVQQGKQDAKGSWHDAYLPALFSAKVGRRVTVSVTNYDPAPHTFTAPGLRLSVLIAPAKAGQPAVTTFTFRAPAKPGAYDWFCAAGCDPWAMAHLGFMRGRMTFTA